MKDRIHKLKNRYIWAALLAATLFLKDGAMAAPGGLSIGTDLLKDIMLEVMKQSDADMQRRGAARVEAESELETETGAETESELETETGAETESELEMETETETESESEPESELDVEKQSETMIELAIETESDTESEENIASRYVLLSWEEAAALMQQQSELETETETETETEPETESPEEQFDRNLKQLLSTLPEDFVFPMKLPRESVSDLLPIYELKDFRELHDLHPFFSEDEKDLLKEYISKKDFSLLQGILEERIAEYEGDWSVYVKNLNTNESFILNDRPMKSASIMKLFVMGTVYKAIETGELERTDELMNLMNNMITVSDNESTNQLLFRLGNSDYKKGIEKVDAFIQEYGFSDMTIEYNGFNNDATVFDKHQFNQVSAKDCGKLLEDIYRREWVNRAVSNEIENMMLNQHTRYKIPKGLPEGVLCGNKTGEMDTTENDAAIVYADNCDYILVVLSSDWGNKDQAINRISEISAEVYQYLNE